MSDRVAGKRIRTKEEKTKLITKSIVFGIMIAIMVAATIALIPAISALKTDDGMDKLLNYIQNKGALGVLIYIGLQAFQVIIPLIPPIQIIGGVLYGSFLGSVYSCIGIYLGMGIVYVIVRLFGYPIVEAMIDGKDLKKFSFLQNSSKSELIFFILYFIPGMPKDTLSFVAPLTGVKTKNYFLFVLPARFPLMILAAVFGSAVRNQEFTFAVILCIIMIDLAILGIIFRDKIISAIKGVKPTDNIKKHKNNINGMIKTGVVINFFSALCLIASFVLSGISLYETGKADFLKDATFNSFGKVFYFLINYGKYFFISLVIVGTVSVLSGLIRLIHFEKHLEALGINNVNVYETDKNDGNNITSGE